ncbi:unnamed protein product [Staurois parvus]|uniref:Uncharacterized protein n=1 Tax=Staurois parvus TaxID=386267 RepID=A0ABN9CLP2_9NEOB|nr:unnamed protein product [Staurois parvus]
MSASDILLTTIHVITDWPISDHMIGPHTEVPYSNRFHALPVRAHRLHTKACHTLYNFLI